jgi:hypothetical protein
MNISYTDAVVAVGASSFLRGNRVRTTVTNSWVITKGDRFTRGREKLKFFTGVNFYFFPSKEFGNFNFLLLFFLMTYRVIP